VLLRAPKTVGVGIDALEGLPLTALTQSPRLVTHAIDVVGEDRIEFFERV
jgi:hypothetical protein